MRALMLALLILAGCRQESAPSQLQVEVFNPHTEAWPDAPISLRLEGYASLIQPHARVYRVEGIALVEVASQLDDLNLDGEADHLFFLANLDAAETARFVVRPDTAAPRYESQVVESATRASSTFLADDAEVFITVGGLVLRDEHGLHVLRDLDTTGTVVADGPLRTVRRTIIDHATGLSGIVERERHARQPWIEQRIRLRAPAAGRPLITGLPRANRDPRLHTGSAHGVYYLYTYAHDATSDETARAVLIPDRFRPSLLPTRADAHLVAFSTANESSAYRFMAQHEPGAAADTTSADAFVEAIRDLAARWMRPVQVTVQTN